MGTEYALLVLRHVSGLDMDLGTAEDQGLHQNLIDVAVQPGVRADPELPLELLV